MDNYTIESLVEDTLDKWTGPDYKEVLKLIHMGWDDNHIRPIEYDFDLIKNNTNHHLVDIKNKQILEDTLGFVLPYMGVTPNNFKYEYTKEEKDWIESKYKKDFEMYRSL